MDLESRGAVYYLCSENKAALMSFAGTAKLICAFVFPYTECLVSCDAAQIMHQQLKDLVLA